MNIDWKSEMQDCVFLVAPPKNGLETSSHSLKNKSEMSDQKNFFWIFQVSKAAADLMAYCEAHIREDPLIVPVPASENPFREKKFFCTILWWAAGRAVQAWRCLASLSSPHLKLLAIGIELSFAKAGTLCCWSALPLVAEGFGGVSYQTGNPVGV